MTIAPTRRRDDRPRRCRRTLLTCRMLTGGLAAAAVGTARAEMPDASTMLRATDLPFRDYAANHFPQRAAAGMGCSYLKR